MEKDVVQLSVADNLWTWFETNKMRLAWGAGIAVVVGFVLAFYVWRQGENEIVAGEALSRAEEGTVVDGVIRRDSSEVYLKVAAEHPGTAAGGRALLQAAAALFVQAKYPESQAQFERFVREQPDSPFLPQAKLGVAASLDAQGKTADAMSAYEGVAKTYSGANVAPQAEFALARIYESQGKLEQAFPLYEKLAQQLGLNDPIGVEASIRAEALRAKMPAAPTSFSPVTTTVLPAALSNAAAVATNTP